MSTTYKNIVATVLGLALMFALAFTLAKPAQAASLSQSQVDAIINLLVSFGADQATIDNVRSALTGQPTSNTGGNTNMGSGSCTPMVFTMNHKMGDMGGEVKNIQKFLNANGFTVAVSGPGSAGNETDYFGPATKAAVIKFQNAYASEILAPVGLTAGTGYWGNSTRAKANAMEQARCAAQNQNNNNNNNQGGQTQTADELMVASVAQPANSLAPAGAVNVPFTRFTLTAGSSDVTVSGVKVKLQGLADRVNFASVVLLDENGMQVGRTRVLQSDYTATVGETLTIPAGQTRTFTVAANVNNTVNTGEVASFAVVEVMANKPVNGTLPIVGAEHTLNGTLSIAQVSLSNGANYPTITTEEIGTTNVYFGSVRVTNNSSNEDVVLKAVRFYQAGSVAPSDLANVKIVVDGQEYPATVSADGKYYSATFNVTVARGLSKDIDIKGDIVSGTGRTVQFQIYEASDLYAEGATYGYGAPVTATFPYDVASSVITINGATVNSLTRSNEAPVANITVNKPNEVLGAFELDLVGEGIDVTTLVVNASLTDTTPTKNANNVITNVTLVDQNGQVLAGPVDYVATGATTGTFTFSGVTFPAGKTVIYVKGQLAASNFDSNDTVTVSTNPSAWSGVRGVQSGSVINISTGNVTANTMNVRLPELNVVTLATPNNDLVSGATNVILATAELDATASGDDVRVSNVTVQGSAATSTVLAGIDNVKIYADMDGDGSFETLVGTAQSFPGAANTETLTFPLNPAITVKKGEKIQIAAIADIASGTTGSITTTFSAASAFAVNTGVTVSPVPVGSGVARTIQANGNITVALGANNPAAKVLLDATSSNNAAQDVLEFKVTADNVEDMNIESITLTQAGDSNNQAVLSYVITDGTQEWTVANDGNASITVDMTANPLNVPAGSYKNITVKVKTNDIDGNTIINGNTAQVDIAANDIVARGIQSQATVNNTAALTGSAHVVYEAYPSVAVADQGASKTLTNSTEMSVMKITLTNEGDKDIEFSNGDSDQIAVSILGDIDAAANFKMKEVETGNTLCSGTMNTNVATCDFATNPLTIPAGGSRTVEVFADTSGLTTTGDTVYARLLDSTGTFVYDINTTGDDYDVSTYILNGNVDGPTYVKP